jgi:hypothetical protein
VAIVLLFTVGTFKGSCGIIGPVVFSVSVFFFILTIVLGLLFLNQASTRYEKELKGANNKKSLDSLVKARKKFSIYRKGAFITFVLGIFIGVTFGVLRFYEKLF